MSCCGSCAHGRKCEGKKRNPNFLYMTNRRRRRNPEASTNFIYEANGERRKNPSERTFFTVAEIKAAAKAQGSHWFDKSTMRFFRSRVGRKAHLGRYFVSSEEGPSGGRRYSIRKATVRGGRLRFDTVGKFQGFRTRGAAMARIKKIRRRLLRIGRK